jgi:hypothetical protein
MSSKKKSSEPKSLLSSIGGSWFGGNESEEDEKQQVEIPEIKESVEKKGGKTRRVSKFGSRRQVWNGSAEMTPGRLRKEHLMKNERGRIVSAKRHTTMKQRHTSE